MLIQGWDDSHGLFLYFLADDLIRSIIFLLPENNSAMVSKVKDLPKRRGRDRK